MRLLIGHSFIKQMFIRALIEVSSRNFQQFHHQIVSNYLYLDQ